MEGEYIIGAELAGQSVTIEPGGQFELSGAPVGNLHETHEEVNSHLKQVSSPWQNKGALLLLYGTAGNLQCMQRSPTRIVLGRSPVTAATQASLSETLLQSMETKILTRKSSSDYLGMPSDLNVG